MGEVAKSLGRPAPAAKTAGVIVLLGVSIFVATIISLHFVQTEYEPTWQLMSELALGPFGGAMFIAFLGLALALLGVQAAIAIGEFHATGSADPSG